jgi:hypothetical protein
MQILQVNQVIVTKISESPLRIQVQAMGLASTGGWKNPRLDNSGDPKPSDAVVELSFEADRPSGVVIQVLSPISATIDLAPKGPVDAVIVKARSNGITVHASDFVGNVPLTTMAIGEEGSGTETAHQAAVTTLAMGEESPFPTFVSQGGEHPYPTLKLPGAEQPYPTTKALGEEAPIPTTHFQAEEGGIPWTSPKIDDPTAPNIGLTTLALGEEGGAGLPGGGPFGTF